MVGRRGLSEDRFCLFDHALDSFDDAIDSDETTVTLNEHAVGRPPIVFPV